ncbi:hypothetical protein V1505DRAFT_396536 [Lipomyces doorenjongii]
MKRSIDYEIDLEYSYARLIYLTINYHFGLRQKPVVTVPSNVHEAGVYRINNEINTYAENYLSTHSPQSLLSIVPLGSTTMRGFHGAFAKCVKQPDGGVWYISRKGKKMVTVVVDVGASERYKKLCRDKDIWIHGLGVKVFILVCVNESPQFKMPSAEYDDIQDLGAEIALMDESMAATLESNLLSTISISRIFLSL